MCFNRQVLTCVVALSIFWLAADVHAAYDSAAIPEFKGLQVIRITPDGEDVPAGKQIVIQFDRPVVPIGKMERPSSEIPVIITPALACEWRWLNTSALACNLPDKAALKEATRYTLEIEPGIKAEDGATIPDSFHHGFITQRPDVNYHEFREWKSPGHPVIRLVFNQAVDKESVAQHVFWNVGDKAERVAVQVSADSADHEPPQWMPIPGENALLFFNKQPLQKSDDDLHKSSGKEARRIWLVEPVQELPLDTHIILKTEPGLMSALGPEPGVSSSPVAELDTYPEFTFLGIKCTVNSGEELWIPAGQKPSGKCDPMRPVDLSFSTPVERGTLGDRVIFNPPVGGWKKISEAETITQEPEEGGDNAEVGYQFSQPHSKGAVYDVWLPGGLKVAQDYTVHSQAATTFFERLWHWLQSWFKPAAPVIVEVQDIFDRKLQQPIAASFATAHRNPNFVLDYSDAVLEKGVDSEVPFYVNNLNNYRFDYRAVTAQGADKQQTFRKAIPRVEDVQFAVPFGVREMLDGRTGALFGTLQTDPVINNSYFPRLFAQVTPYQVHYKLGHFNSLVWVTDMATGQPVADARVSLYQDAFTTLHTATDISAKASTDTSGVALLPGTDTLDPDLSITTRYQDEASRYFLSVEKDDDMALLPIAQSFTIDTYRASGSVAVYPYKQMRYGHTHAWGTTAQGIYRAGDIIQYKIYVRNQDNNGFIPPPAGSYRLKIIDPMGKEVHERKDISLSAFGGTSGEFTVPKAGAVGWYQFKLIGDFAKKPENAQETNQHQPDTDNDSADKKTWLPMRVLVSDFTPSPFRVSNQLNGDLFHAGEQVNVATHAELHSGGAYTDAATRVTALLESAPFSAKHPLAKNFQFDSYQNETPSQQIFQKIDKVNDKGESALHFATGTPQVVYGKLLVESAVADDRGKYISSQARADYLGVDRLVGLYSSEWLYQVGKAGKLQYIVVDERGNPAKGTAVEIALEHQTTKAARVKGAGNAYLTEYHNEWETAGHCQGLSAEAPLDCRFTPAKAGVYRAIATIKDTKGKAHSTTLSTYAVGDDFVVWNNENDSGLTIVPESTSYKIGDTARYLVKNPYPNAKALITIERYGVIDHFVQTFTTSTPVVEFKIKPEHLPGFYLSVVIVSPRVDKPLDLGQVDLGKPTYRMGYVTVPVKDPYKEMRITAQTDREIYKPRDKVTVKLHAEPRMKDKNEPIELAVAVLDESVFDLIAGGKSYYDPYQGFYTLDSLDLGNYSLLTRLVGRQRFEKKGANPGGDGGANLSMRSLFKFISYWNAELKTDNKGDATISFDAPDNLTGWRILAIATTPTDRFGLGDANFKVNRPTEVRPVLPNQVMEGDHFDAGFSVMNRTDKPRTLKVSIHAEGQLDAAKTPADLTKTVTIEPYKRVTVSMPIQTTAVAQTRDTQAGNLRFTITAGDRLDSDGLVHSLPVNKRRSLNVAANYGTTTQNKIDEAIQFPKDMLPDIGSVSVIASPTVIGNVSGAFKYMRDYPYLCWEQKLSKGVMAAHYKNLKAYLPDSLQWEGSESLSQTTLEQAASFQAANGGMTYFVAQDRYVDPYLSAYTAIAFNWLRKSGYTIPDEVENKLHTYLGNLLKNDAVPDFYSEGMTSTVRAVALAALAERGKVSLSDLERYQPHVKKMSLFGKSHFLQAALAVKDGEKYAPEVANMILATANQTGGKFVFSETWDDSYTRILASPLRENCAVLDAFTAYGERGSGKNLVGDVPFKLVRAITQSRKNRDHWENTQENMFCMNALIEFARIYEKDKPDMTVTAAMDRVSFGKAVFKDVRDPAAQLERPVKAGDAGRKTSVQIQRIGQGRLYFATRLAYALPSALDNAANAGIEVHREYSVERAGKWELLKTPLQIKRGELIRVDLYVSVPAARNFVVVDDAVAGGLEPVNRDLATASEVDAKKGDFNAAGGAFWFKYSDWTDFGASFWSFYHQEIRHDSVRFYSDYLPAGNYHLSYTAQAIATGAFSVLPAMAQEMYDPDVYGKTEAINLQVGE
ncbi:MAG: alpha-2-macroglobulin family protein [Methylovulum sp.]|uniref:Ig-like domain-containing alpha-2-macroglobulin family protein n=1 Tax=Methylovulum sp. TaxID=1916980 RepID=UPI00262EAEDC|nr:Ig-like domain-containing alpha-2-macroglobulin family protein [Methylovulum sp.]MDD2723228.1 alpha-2-macroglobulin family protein [Methylovulum sp.]MDD5123169.1 alpha-2-macroglobulin family protein [Methylovulum sp.]